MVILWSIHSFFCSCVLCFCVHSCILCVQYCIVTFIMVHSCIPLQVDDVLFCHSCVPLCHLTVRGGGGNICVVIVIVVVYIATIFDLVVVCFFPIRGSTSEIFGFVPSSFLILEERGTVSVMDVDTL